MHAATTAYGIGAPTPPAAARTIYVTTAAPGKASVTSVAAADHYTAMATTIAYDHVSATMTTMYGNRTTVHIVAPE